MLKRMILGAAAVAFTTPAMATCLEDRIGAQCDIFLDEYRADDVPVGTTMVWPDEQFVIEDFDYPGVGVGVETSLQDDVLFWDGDDAHVVPEGTGPLVEIADW